MYKKRNEEKKHFIVGKVHGSNGEKTIIYEWGGEE